MDVDKRSPKEFKTTYIEIAAHPSPNKKNSMYYLPSFKDPVSHTGLLKN